MMLGIWMSLGMRVSNELQTFCRLGVMLTAAQLSSRSSRLRDWTQVMAPHHSALLK